MDPGGRHCICVFLYLVVTNWIGAITHLNGKLLFQGLLFGLLMIPLDVSRKEPHNAATNCGNENGFLSEKSSI